MRLSTQTVAAASARHPWRTIGAWIAIVVLAIVAIVTLLGGSLTTEGAPTNNPESERADEALFRALPPDPDTAVSDIVVIRSDEHTVDSPEFESYVRDFVADEEIAALGRARTYLDDPAAGLVSEDGHATIVPIALTSEDETEALIEKIEAHRRGRARSPSRSRARRRSTTTSTSSRRRTSRTES